MCTLHTMHTLLPTFACIELNSFIFTVSFLTLGRSTTLIQSKFSGQFSFCFFSTFSFSHSCRPLVYMNATYLKTNCIFFFISLCYVVVFSVFFLFKPFTVLQKSTAHLKLARQNPQKSLTQMKEEKNVQKPKALYHRRFILIFPFFILVKCFNGHLWRCDMIFEYANFNGINLHI